MTEPNELHDQLIEASKAKYYLGDGLYVHHDGYHIILTAPRDYSVDHWVALEPSVLSNFDLYREKLNAIINKLNEISK